MIKQNCILVFEIIMGPWRIISNSNWQLAVAAARYGKQAALSVLQSKYYYLRHDYKVAALHNRALNIKEQHF